MNNVASAGAMLREALEEANVTLGRGTGPAAATPWTLEELEKELAAVTGPRSAIQDEGGADDCRPVYRAVELLWKLEPIAFERLLIYLDVRESLCQAEAGINRAADGEWQEHQRA